MVRVTNHPTLEELRARREEILRIATKHGATNVRIFGSVARGEADAASDVDILVDIVQDVPGFAYFGILEDLRRAFTSRLGYNVHVIDSAGLSRMRDWVSREAVPL